LRPLFLPADLRARRKMELNNEQQAVCQKDQARAVKVMAGAGTGKTRVLVARYVHCVTQDRIPPDRILALTFTNKAAGEMKKRIFTEVSELADPTLLWSLYGAWIMNFHSFGRRILAENAPAFGIDPALDVASGVDVARIKRYLRKRFETGQLAGLPVLEPAEAPLPKEFQTRFDKMIRIMNKCRSLLLSSSDLAAAVTADDHAGYRDYVSSVIAVWQAYESELRRRGLIDFENMIELVARGLRDYPDVRAKYTGRFDYILVDEFQDTSDAQNELLRLLSGGDFRKVMVVGDEKQSIYRWRDARVENIRQFPGETAVLKKNYRSTQGILDLAFHFICTDPYFEERKEELHLEAHRGNDGAPVVLFHPVEETGKSVDTEAKALAAWITHLTGSADVPGFPPLKRESNRPPLKYDDVSILLRSLRSDSGLDSYEKALQAAGIPYAVVGGANAVEKVVYRQIVSLLSILTNPADIAALVTVLEARPFSLDDAALSELFAGARRLAGPDVPPTVDQMLSAEARQNIGCEKTKLRCARLSGFIERLKLEQAELELRTFLTQLLEDGSFFLELFDSQATSSQALSLSRELIQLADGLRRRNEANLSTFLEHLRRRIDDREYGDKSEALLPPGRVRIMTIHQAKGLEFPAVAVAGIRQPKVEGTGFYVSRTKGLYLNDKKEWQRGYEGLEERDADRDSMTQESYCLLYVAMTRAEDYLFISSPHPEGIADKEKRTLFADLLASVRDNDLLAIEMRKPPDGIAPAGPDPAVPFEATPEHGLAALTQWRSARQVMTADRSRLPVYPPGIVAVNWRGLHWFEQCPRMYYYRFLVGLGEVPALDDSDSADGPDKGDEKYDSVQAPAADDSARYGTLIHRALERIMKRPDHDRTVKACRLEELYDQSGLPMVGKNKRLRVAGQTIEAFLNSEAAAGRPVILEEPFFYRLSRVVVQGILDRVDKDDVGYRVIDYKTGQPNEHHIFQIQFYVWALRKIKKTDQVTGVLIYLNNGTDIKNVDTGPASMAIIERAAGCLEDAIIANRFEAEPGKNCEACPCQVFCPAVPAKEN
jgi:superfamily I DNA/RNA helicase/RecB family exonuclease